jgi:hypothetical protein
MPPRAARQSLAVAHRTRLDDRFGSSTQTSPLMQFPRAEQGIKG